MSDYDYIGENISKALKKNEHGNLVTNSDWLLKVAAIQSGYAQVQIMERIAGSLRRIEEHFRRLDDQRDEQKAKERDAAIANSTILQELDNLGAPAWVIEALQRLMKNEYSGKLATMNLDELRTEVTQRNNLYFHFPMDSDDYGVETGLQRALRILLLDEPDPHNFLRLDDKRQHPLWVMINGLSLSARNHSTWMRRLIPTSFLWWMTPSLFMDELQKDKGGDLAHVYSIGKVGLDEMRKALCPLEIRKDIE